MKIESILVTLFIVAVSLSCTGQPPSNGKRTLKQSDKTMKILTDAEVVNGAERLNDYLPLLRDKNVACVVNQTSRIGRQHLVDVLLNKEIAVLKIFAPEHGFRGTADAGSLINDGKDKRSGLPIMSLYGKTKQPQKEDLADLDIVVFDIQDAGARFYTYLSTLFYVMQACADNNIQFVLLDRPNPNGFYVDGPMLDPNFSSFVGLLPIPVVHGMTLGELANLFVGEHWIKNNKLNYTVIECQGYSHADTYDLPIPPSPNLPNHRSIMLYPSLCFFEPTDFSIGRGTGQQFQVIGRPDNIINNYTFIPKPQSGAMTPKHEGISCFGEDLRDIDLDELYARKELDLSYVIKYLSGNNIDLIRNISFFDKLAGSDVLRKQLSESMSEVEIREYWATDLQKFKLIRAHYLLYP